LAAWVKQDKNGNSFLSLAISDPYVKKDEPKPIQNSNAKADDLPF
jgi:uncharacterized protein (DUF736 family)